MARSLFTRYQLHVTRHSRLRRHPIPKRLLQRPAEFLADAFDSDQHLIITSTHILKSIHPKHIPYLIYSKILKNVGVSAVFC